MNLEKRKADISFIRMCATVAIVTCHVMQYYDNVLCAWFNCGVQVFLFISGYLYSQKRSNAIDFYKKSLSKLLIDYWIYLVIILCAVRLLNIMPITKEMIVGLFTCSQQLPFLAHFWFLKTIIVCYFALPLLWWIFDSWEEKGTTWYLALICVVLHIFIKRIAPVDYTPAWVETFILGVIFSRIEKMKKIHIVKIIIYLLCIVVNGIQIYYDYIKLPMVGNWFANENNMVIYRSYGHLLMGVAITILVKDIYNKLQIKAVWWNKLLALSDKLSYDIYITHHAFCFLPFSILALFGKKSVAIVVYSVAVVVTAGMLNILSTYVRMILQRSLKSVHKF